LDPLIHENGYSFKIDYLNLEIMDTIKAVKTIMLISLFLVVTSCRDADVAKLRSIDFTSHIERQDIRLSEIAKSVEYIQLETSKESFISMVSDIQFTKEIIAVFDNQLQKLFVFDRSGKFLNVISNLGKGPEEYIHLFSFAIDPDTSTLYLHTPIDRILKFQFDNTFEDEIKLAFGKILRFTKIKKGFLCYVARPNRALFSGVTCFILSESGSLIKKVLVRESSGVGSSFMSYFSFYCLADTTCFWESGFDTIYGVSNKTGTITPRYLLNLGSGTVSGKDYSTKERLDAEIKQGGMVIASVFESTSFFIFSIIQGGKIKKLFYDKNSSRMTDLPMKWQIGLINDLDLGPRFLPEYSVNDSVLCEVIESYELQMYMRESQGRVGTKDPILLKALDDPGSNPIIMLVNLK